MKHRFTHRERLKSCSSQVLYSREFQAYYLVMIILNTFALAFTMAYPKRAPNETWLLWLEAFLTMTIVVEVVLRFAAQGKDYCTSGWNLCDVGLTVLVIASFSFFFALPSLMEEIEDAVQFVLRIARDLVMLLHFVRGRRQMRAFGNDAIVLGEADDASDDEIDYDENGAVASPAFAMRGTTMASYHLVHGSERHSDEVLARMFPHRFRRSHSSNNLAIGASNSEMRVMETGEPQAVSSGGAAMTDGEGAHHSQQQQHDDDDDDDEDEEAMGRQEGRPLLGREVSSGSSSSHRSRATPRASPACTPTPVTAV